MSQCSTDPAPGIVELVYDALPDHGFETQEVCRARFVNNCILEHVDDGMEGEMLWRSEEECVDKWYT